MIISLTPSIRVFEDTYIVVVAVVVVVVVVVVVHPHPPFSMPTGGQCRRLSLDHLEGFSGALLRAAELESWSLRHVKVVEPGWNPVGKVCFFR